MTRATTLLAATLTGLALTAPAAAERMVLRDAIYLYNQDIRSYRATQIVGHRCDVLQLVLDVESGYTDLAMHEGGRNWTYPDRMRDYFEMFAYALYDQNVTFKRFVLADNEATDPARDVLTGRVTVFGYCYSSRSDAYVFRHDGVSNSCSRNDQPIACPANGQWSN